MNTDKLESHQRNARPHKIFIVGNSRSGTHLMSRILGNHSAVFAFRELHFFEYLWNPITPSPILSVGQATRLAARLLTIQRDGYFTQGDPQQNRQEAQAIVEKHKKKPLTPFRVFELFLGYETQRYGKFIPCDHTPRNLFYLREILEFYPNACVVNMVRDPRDVLLSQKKKWRRRTFGASSIPRREVVRAWANYHPATISILWNSAIRAGDAFTSHPRVLQVKFEKLVSSPRETVEGICAFLSLEFQEKMLQMPQVGSSHRSDAPDQLGIDPKASGRWRRGGLNKAELYICQQITGKNMKLHDYELRDTYLPLPSLVFYGVTWLLKSGLALLFNIDRSRSIFSSLNRRFRHNKV